MKLKSGDMLFMDYGSDALKLQIIGRGDVPRVEREGRGWRDGDTVLLKGTNVADFLDALDYTSGMYVLGGSGLSVKIGYNNSLPAHGRETSFVVLFTKDVSVKLTWPERTLLMYAVRNFAWKMFM
jgi:hypothetical protein